MGNGTLAWWMDAAPVYHICNAVSSVARLRASRVPALAWQAVIPLDAHATPERLRRDSARRPAKA